MSHYLIASLSLIAPIFEQDKELKDLRPAPSRALQAWCIYDKVLERGEHCGVHTKRTPKVLGLPLPTADLASFSCP